MATTALDVDTAPHGAMRDNAQLLDELRAIVGRGYVLTSPETTRRYRTGFRFETGPALAVPSIPASAGARSTPIGGCLRRINGH